MPLRRDKSMAVTNMTGTSRDGIPESVAFPLLTGKRKQEALMEAMMQMRMSAGRGATGGMTRRGMDE